MGLFSSSSKSSSTSNYTDSSKATSGTIGDLSRNNVIVTGDYAIDGLSDELANNVLTKMQELSQNTADDIKKLAGEAMSQTASAYSGANASIVATSDQTRSLLKSFEPIALIVAGAFTIWAVFGGK